MADTAISVTTDELLRKDGGGQLDSVESADMVSGERVKKAAGVSYADIAKHFGVLGWTAFGGPSAHLGMFQQLFVDR